MNVIFTFKFYVFLALCMSYMHIKNLVMSCPLFGLVGGYKSVNERRTSRVTIQSAPWYKLLWACTVHHTYMKINMKFPLRHMHDYHNPSTFIKINVMFTCELYTFLALYMSYIHLKFDDAMPLIWSCRWLQIGQWETLVPSHDSAPTLI